ncbi:HK97 family phage prohead protease [Glycomyces paridis]|uniref:HK97 family phage prohead protease n=1 Tax=Glycomyces paridis TaxID=2126555 RepID=A0A4S8PHX4_9ACTN|nr:HK97 family phage prohead protease [Glycomyces paridis]THV27934.1 HK97 family phage prohead protease [Glycomyces paridis]
MHIKSLPAQIKAAGDGAPEGEVEAIVAAYNIDDVGDKIIPGAFAATLAEWKASGDPLPFIWSHQHNNLDAHIGEVVDAKEIDEGLWIKAQLDMDDPAAVKVWRLLKGRRIRKFSFAYEVKSGAWVDTEHESYYELRELGLYEVGPTLIPANPQTDLLAAKAALDHRAKATRPDGADDAATIQALHDQTCGLGAKCAKTEDTTDTDPATRADGPANDEAHQGKSQEPARRSPASLVLSIDTDLYDTP